MASCEREACRACAGIVKLSQLPTTDLRTLSEVPSLQMPLLPNSQSLQRRRENPAIPARTLHLGPVPDPYEPSQQAGVGRVFCHSYDWSDAEAYYVEAAPFRHSDADVGRKWCIVRGVKCVAALQK